VGYAVVEYHDPSVVDNVCSALHGFPLEDRTLIVMRLADRPLGAPEHLLNTLPTPSAVLPENNESGLASRTSSSQPFVFSSLLVSIAHFFPLSVSLKWICLPSLSPQLPPRPLLQELGEKPKISTSSMCLIPHKRISLMLSRFC